MLTGDNAATAKVVAESLGVDEVRADLMPEDKVRAIAELQAQGHRVAMVGMASTTRRRWRVPMSVLPWAAAERRPLSKPQTLP